MVTHPNRSKRRFMACVKCGSSKVRRDAWAEWDDRRNEWVLGATFDHAICEGGDCNGGECRIVETRKMPADHPEREESSL